jgi:hypothetical protein
LNADIKLEDLLTEVSSFSTGISITPIASPPSFIIVFPVNGERRGVQISVLENGELDADVEEHLKRQLCGLIDIAGIGVGIEFLKKELSKS